jgi:hypothetical protein
MNSPAIEPTQPPEKATLFQFIEENSKLVTSIAAFIALAAFSSQWDNISDIKSFFPALPILAAALLSLELLSRLPPEPHQWRLGAFTTVLSVSVFSMIWYWFAKFRTVWGLVLFTVVQLFLFIVLPALVAHLFTKATSLVITKLFHREIRTITMQRISQSLFFLLIACLFLVFIWISHRFGGRQFTVHLPSWLG